MRPETFDSMLRSVKMDIETLQILYQNLDRNALEKAVELLKASTLTVTSACGSSSFAAQKFAHALCCIERPAKYIPPSEAVHGGMGVLKKNNTIVLVSKGGETEELLPLAGIAQKSALAFLS